jgi:hypothetical protein
MEFVHLLPPHELDLLLSGDLLLPPLEQDLHEAAEGDHDAGLPDFNLELELEGLAGALHIQI